jgi:predicted AAA+ superfamily ATPase
MAPQLWDAVRHHVDLKDKPGLFILTGSTTVDYKKIFHSGAGRISRIMMRTMSLFESLDSNGSISLEDLFNGKHDIQGISKLGIKDIAGLIVRGGWPGTIGKYPKIATRQISSYCDIVSTVEIQTVDGKKRDEEKTRSILKSLARHTSTTANEKTILEDVSAKHSSMHRNTLSDYINTLKKLYIIDDLPAWSPKLRSKSIIRTSDKRHLIDPAISACLLNASSDDLLFDMNTFGLLFESLVVRDLRIYAQAIGGTLFHYRDNTGLEADAVVHLHDGRWGLIEVKLGATSIDAAAANLIKLKEKINTTEMHEPSFLMIVTGTEFAYKRDDNVLVVPIGCLKN